MGGSSRDSMLQRSHLLQGGCNTRAGYRTSDIGKLQRSHLLQGGCNIVCFTSERERFELQRSHLLQGGCNPPWFVCCPLLVCFNGATFCKVDVTFFPFDKAFLYDCFNGATFCKVDVTTPRAAAFVITSLLQRSHLLQGGCNYHICERRCVLSAQSFNGATFCKVDVTWKRQAHTLWL